MRYLAVLLATLSVVACSTAPTTRREPQAMSPAQILAEPASIDPVAQLLLTAAATDFHNHSPSTVRFREVHVWHKISLGGKEQYMLCGQFLPARDGSEAEWTPFATIKTSGYEQWLGAQAAGFCKGSSLIGYREGDLSSLLQTRLDSLR
jgi:hypothetical protein